MEPKEIANEKLNSSQSANSKRNFSIEDKVKILKSLENGASRNEVRKIYDLPQSTLMTIIKNRNKILKSVNDSASQRQRIRNSKWVALDSKLFAWYQEQKSNDHRITRIDLMEQMVQLSNDIPGCNITAKGTSWVSRFCYRHGIKNLDKYRKRKCIQQDQPGEEVLEELIENTSGTLNNILYPTLNDAINSINLLASFYHSRDCYVNVLKSIMDIEDDLEKILWMKKMNENVL